MTHSYFAYTTALLPVYTGPFWGKIEKTAIDWKQMTMKSLMTFSDGNHNFGFDRILSSTFKVKTTQPVHNISSSVL